MNSQEPTFENSAPLARRRGQCPQPNQAANERSSQKSILENLGHDLSGPASAEGMPTPSRVPPLTDDERAALMLEIRKAGETDASRRLGIPRQTMARALARLKIQAGSVLLIRSALASTKPPSPTTSAAAPLSRAS